MYGISERIILKIVLNHLEDKMFFSKLKDEIDNYISDEYIKGKIGDVIDGLNKQIDDILGGKDIHEDFDTIKEISDWIGEHKDVYNKLKEISDWISEHKDVYDKLEELSQNNLKQLNELIDRCDTLENSLESIKGDVSEITSNVETIETDVNNLRESLENYVLQSWVEDQNYLTHQDISNKIDWVKNDKGINSILLPNFGMIVGEPNLEDVEGKAKADGNCNLLMLSKWNVVDLGSTKYPINLNGSKDRPTYNDSKEIALVEDIENLGIDNYALTSYVEDKIENIQSDIVTKIGELKLEHDSDLSKTKEEFEGKLESKQQVGNYVEYTDYIEGRKTIQLNNYDSISGITTTGGGVNLAMVSKWDVADFGSKQIHINLNGSKTRPTYNDGDEIALISDIESAKNAILGDGKLNESFDTLKEVSDWIVNNGPEAKDMFKSINKLEKGVKSHHDDINTIKTNIIAINESLGNKIDWTTSDVGGVNKKIIMLPNQGMLMGEVNKGYTQIETDQSSVSIAQVSQWNCVDLGNYHLPMILSVPEGQRPIVQAKKADIKNNPVALVSDIYKIDNSTDLNGKLESFFVYKEDYDNDKEKIKNLSDKIESLEGTIKTLQEKVNKLNVIAQSVDEEKTNTTSTPKMTFGGFGMKIVK